MARPYKVINEKILPYINLWPLKLEGLTFINARYRNAKVYTLSAFQLQSPLNPLRQQRQKRWEKRTDPLWWSIISHKNLQTKRTVRSWASRRVKHAFTEALRKQGFTADGTHIEGTGKQNSLYGTLQLSTEPSALKASCEQLAEEAGKVVLEIIRLQGRGHHSDNRAFVKIRKQGKRGNEEQQSEQKPQRFAIRMKRI